MLHVHQCLHGPQNAVVSCRTTKGALPTLARRQGTFASQTLSVRPAECSSIVQICLTRFGNRPGRLFYLGAANRRVRTYAVYARTRSRTIKRRYTAPQTESAPMSRFGNAHSQHKQSPDSLPKRVVLSCDTGTQPNGVPHKRRHIETREIHAPNGAHACHLTRF